MHQNNNMFIVFYYINECKNIIVIYKLILLINIISMYYTDTMSLFPAALVCWFSIIKCVYCQCYSDSGEWSYRILCNGLIDYL